MERSGSDRTILMDRVESDRLCGMKRFVVVNGRLADRYEETARRLSAISGEFVAEFGPDDTWMDHHIGEVEIVCGSISPHFVARAGTLRWVQLQGAGVEGVVELYSGRHGVIVTNATGIHGIPMAEHLLGMMLSFAHLLHISIRRGVEKRWDRSICDNLFELSGRHALVVGAGSIGAAFAERASALGMKVSAIRRNPELPVAGASRVESMESLTECLRDADFVIDLLPATEETERVFGKAEFDAMKSGAYFLNAGRGRTVDESALVEALRSGSIAGAGLDVFEAEPLPADSSLWEMENVILTPHVSGDTPEYSRRLLDIFSENFERYIAGKKLNNTIDLDLGY